MSLTIDTNQRGDSSPYEGLPSVERDLSCKAQDPPVAPHVAVDVLDTEDETWTRLPNTAVETERTKDGPSAITTTARVDFPAEWGGEDILQYVSGYQSLKAGVEDDGEEIDPATVDPEDVYDACRIWYQDQTSGLWVVNQYGYIGGVGPTTDAGVFKFYVYDPADLFRGISVSKSFSEPDTIQMLNFVLDGTDDRGEDVGIQRRSVFRNIRTSIIGEGAAELAINKASLVGAAGTTLTDLALRTDDNIFSSLFSSEENIVDDATDFLFGDDENDEDGTTRGFFSGNKNFKANRHNLAQVLDWFATRVGAQWFFDPTPDGPVLVFDATDDGPPRREFADIEIADNVDRYSDVTFGEVNVLNNNAIADIKPINRVTVNGEGVRQQTGLSGDGLNQLPTYTAQYPTATAVYRPLLQRAGGYKYGPTDVNTDAESMAAAEGDAINELREHLNEATDGTIQLTGEPFAKPYDYLTVIPVCDDVFPNADTEPITFEVNSVRHVKKATERYVTECDVSFVFDESKVETTSTLNDI